jgi:hypothetical protein
VTAVALYVLFVALFFTKRKITEPWFYTSVTPAMPINVTVPVNATMLTPSGN